MRCPWTRWPRAGKSGRGGVCMEFAWIDASQAGDIAKLAVCLTSEIVARTGTRHFDVEVRRLTRLCEAYLRDGRYGVVAAFDAGRIVGFATLCESCSLYAEGAFGIVQEFYVQPEYRSQGIGERLVNELVTHARSRGWRRLELCTPPLPEFERTVAFYRANGFEVPGSSSAYCYCLRRVHHSVRRTLSAKS